MDQPEHKANDYRGIRRRSTKKTKARPKSAEPPRFAAPLDVHYHMCHNAHVTLFHLTLRPGESIFDQLVFAAKKTSISGELRPGQAFPSVRFLATQFKIHPNTAHKVVQHLIQSGWLEVRPGIGTVVAPIPEPRAGERKNLLKREVEQLAVEAKRVGLEVEDVIEAIQEHWAKLEKRQEVSRK